MAISQSSVQEIAEVLSIDFNEYLQDTYGLALNELLADAANNFIDGELGEVDDDLFYDLALALMDRATLS